ncbi:hypothetical protein BKA66DRAFT_503964 [Pyrenochaeta sp. MPI-SDFR-AT-0127]|nr:hypothetical protein BKA66DRAFT_503964 [Pyrenochaeta sp. MPI-SDFR-AT-0127]
MYSQTLFSYITLLLAALAQGKPFDKPARLQARSCGETATLVCYGGTNGGTSQNIDTADIEYAGAYLRHLADTAGNPLWTMPPETDCSEWSLPIFDAGTVLALVKHITPRSNSSITYYDIARTIDGLERDGSTKSSNPSLLSACATNGGQLGIVPDTTNEAYTSASYKASKATPSGLIVKLVRDPNST